MISRRSLGKLLASAAAFFGLNRVEAKPVAVIEPIPWKPNIPTYMDDYQKFIATPYMKRMDFANIYCGYDETLDSTPQIAKWGPGNLDYESLLKEGGLNRKFAYINKQVLEFREQEPIKLTGKRLKPMKECWLEAVAEVNARYGIKE